MMAIKSATTRRHTALAVATVCIALVGMMAMVRGDGVTPPKCGTMPASECTFTYTAPNTSQAYTFNFSSLCSEDGYVLTDGDVALHTYVANICGSTHTPCYPATWTGTFVYGVATQFWGATPECKDPPTCQDEQGNAVCCTADCEVLGVGPPIMSLIDPSNPYTGGVRLRYHDVPANASDPFYCSYDHVNRKPYNRTVTYELLCNESVTGLAKPVSAKQSNTQDCNYTLTFSTAKACGPVPPPVTTTSGSGTSGSGTSGSGTSGSGTSGSGTSGSGTTTTAGSGTTTGSGSTNGGSTTTGDHGGGGGQGPVVIVLVVVVVLLGVVVIALLAVYKPWQDRCGGATGDHPRRRLMRTSGADVTRTRDDADEGASAYASVDVSPTGASR